MIYHARIINKFRYTRKLCYYKQTMAVSTSAYAAAAATDYQYLQRSKLPTMKFQRSLPRLPIPLLEKTCERFLNATRPILSKEEYEETSKCVAQFQSGIGMDLHVMLKQSDALNKDSSYISEPWFDMYLSDRTPLPLNYNPLLVMKNETRPEFQPQLVRATNLVISSLRFWRSLQEGLLEPEVYHLNPKKSNTESFRRWMRLAPEAIATYLAYAFKAFPLDMSQYNRLFGVTRVPELNKDRLVQSSNSTHIMVMRRGNIYAVDVLNKADGSILAPNVILHRLRCVIDVDEKRSAAEVPLGILTAGERNSWALTRQHIVECSQNNADLLQNQIDSALFCLCLDTNDDPVHNENDPLPLYKHLLAGHGKNRWFDKSVSLLISADGTAAINFEHSWGDGVAVLRYFNEIYKETTAAPFVSAAKNSEAMHYETGGVTDGVQQIDFHIDNILRKHVELAIAKHAAIVNSLNINMLRYPKLNKTSCKNDKISPDSIMQLSFQLAYRQAFNKYVGTYESCSTAAFRHGRTETIRPCTMATKEFCDAILRAKDKRAGAKELRAMIDKCSAAHGQLTKEAAMGQGFDRHLFVLKCIALNNKISTPDIFNTKGYKKINHNIISTSTLSSDALLIGAFGPVVANGLGVGYSMQNDECGAIVTSYENQGNGKLFIDSLEQAFNDIHNVIDLSKK